MDPESMDATTIADAADLGRGAYFVLFELPDDTVVTSGRLGTRTYAAGWYAYVGSARRGISGRVGHHLRSPKRRPRWHIDYLLPHGEPAAVVAVETDRDVECRLAASLGPTLDVIPRFGSSDCKCPGHLFRGEHFEPLLHATQTATRSVGCSPKVVLLRPTQPISPGSTEPVTAV